MQTQTEDKLHSPLSWQSIAYRYLLITSVFYSIYGLELKCTCTTSDCANRGLTTCTTVAMCFTQFLDHKDGSNTLIRGCTETKTPLLCENMRPAVPLNKWPVLVCCDDRDMCNDQVVPTLPASGLSKVNVTQKKKSDSSAISDVEDADAGSGGFISLLSSPVYISVVVVGIVLLILIGSTAICILRGQQRFYRRQWPMDRGNYEKGRHTIIPDVTSVEVATKVPTGKYSRQQIPLLESVKTLST